MVYINPTNAQTCPQANLFDVYQFDKNHYFYYDDPLNGEFHEVVPGKFIAFRGPSGDRVELVSIFSRACAGKCHQYSVLMR